MGAFECCKGGGRSVLPVSLAVVLVLTAAPARGMPQWRPLDGRVNSPVAIRRLNGGDVFRDAGGLHGSCAEDFCRSAGGSREVSSTDPGLRGFWGRCTCRCPKKAPSFREDLHKCADNIDECSLADFVSSLGDENQPSTSQKLPLVLLPLRGQILHPSAVIKIDGISMEQRLYQAAPKCSVTSAHFLTRHGWVQLSNSTTDIMDNLGSHLGIIQSNEDDLLLYREFRTPFGVYEERDKIHLKWLGELNMRELLGGRMILVQLSCQTYDLDEPIIQCVGFRVAGTISMTQGIREMTFDGQETTGPDFVAGSNARNNAATGSSGDSTGLTPSEWIAIAAASLFLGAIYVASVFLYLNLKKSGKNNNNCSEDKEKNSNGGKHIGCMGGRIWRKESTNSNNDTTSSTPDGIVKTNPLLILHQCHQHHKRQNSFYSQGSGKNGCANAENKPSSEDSNDDEPHHKSSVSSSPMILNSTPNMEGLSSDEETINNNIGPRDFHHSSQLRVTSAMVHSSTPASSPIERLPEENVSIVEAPSPPTILIPPSIELSMNMRTEPPDSLPPDITSDDPFVPSLFSSSPEALLAAMMGMNGSAMGDNYGQSRRKLYFNPAYFEPELLQAPPPAALEFLSKIREVIALARHRMAAKRFSPSLLGIPEADEEDSSSATENSAKGQDNSPIPILPNLKRENSRHSGKPRDKAIQRWLADMNSTSKVSADALSNEVGPEIGMSPPLPLKKKSKAPPVPSLVEETNTVVSDAKKAMNAVIRELEIRRGVSAACKWDKMNENGIYEVDSLEKTKKSAVGSCLEVVTTKNNKASGAKMVDDTSSVKLYRLPQLLSRVDGYSLVSEVYVNDTYNTIGRVNRDTAERNDKQSTEKNAIPREYDRQIVNMETDELNEDQVVRDAAVEGEKIAEETIEEMEVKEVLTITLEDSPSNHRRTLLEEETFEMDTLDRKKNDESTEDDSTGSISAFSDECNYMDSLERPLRRISLHSSGSFRSDTMGRVYNNKSICKNSGSATDLASVLAASPLTRAYGSLREVYEARQRRRREQRRRRTSDITARNAYGPGRHHNISALPTWRLARRSPESDPNYYPYKPQCYSPVPGQSKNSSLHLLLMPQDKKNYEEKLQKPSSPSSQLKNQFEAVKTPKIPSNESTNYSPSKHGQQQFSNTQLITRIEPTAHLEYFKQEGLYTSPFCDEDEDDDADTAEDDDDNNIPHDSLDQEMPFSSPILEMPMPNENISMFSFWQNMQNRSQILAQNDSTGSRKERMLQKSLASEGLRIALELQQELNGTQQINSATNVTKKQGDGGIGKMDNNENGRVAKRTWRRLIEKREKERVAEEETSREVRARGMKNIEGVLRKAMGSKDLVGKHNERKELKFRVEDSGYLSSSDESALGRVSLRKKGNRAMMGTAMDDEDNSKKADGDMASDSEGESVFDGASESGAESIATDSFFGSFRVFSTAAQKAEQLQKQRQRCSALFEMISEGNLNGLERAKVRHTSEEDATDSDCGAFQRVTGSPKCHPFTKAH